MTQRGFLLATLFCCGFFGISVTLEVILRVYVPSLWNRLYTGVYNGVVWLPDSPDKVQKRFIETKELVEISLFGITNLDDVQRGRYKPIMERIGPYVFQKRRRRTNVTWLDGGEQVVFLQGDSYTFVESMSVGKLDDTVVTLNIPLVGVLEMILSKYSSSGKLSEMLQLVAHMVESWGDERVSGVFMARSVGELLFGYSDPLLSILSQLIPGIQSEFYLLDSQSEQSFTMRTGKNTFEELGEIIRWQGVDEIRSWKEPEVVQGTDGRQFSPSIQESPGQMANPYNVTRRVWVAEAFRSFEMVPSHGYSIEGVEVVRIMPAATAFSASEKYYQEYDGLMNITRPLHAGVDGDKTLGAGPRLFLSLPGFCNVDPAVSSTVEGVLCTNDDDNPHIFLDIGTNNVLV